MAKKLKADSPIKGVSKEDLLKAFEEVSRHKKNASEYAGYAGKATASAVERHGLDKTAFTMVRRMSEFETGKRDATIRALLDYAWKAGFFAQFAMFDDIRQTLRAILEDIEANDNGKAPPEGAATLDALTGTYSYDVASPK